jgi:metal-sulfur cluster biosynthetic enzyme
MDVTLLGIVTEVRLEQKEKALFPMDVTLLGIVTEVRLEQPEKA